MCVVYNVAGHSFSVSGRCLCDAVNAIEGFSLFETNGDMPVFSFVEGDNVPIMQTVLYTLLSEKTRIVFGRTLKGYMLEMHPEVGRPLFLWCEHGVDVVSIFGNYSVHILRFAMWMGYGIMTLRYATIAIHSSCIIYNDRAVLFLGESGTGKSTHTRLWRENFDNAFLLNDDSPILRIIDDKVWVYGSPWSGKTPCYKNDRYRLAACVRLFQKEYNKMEKLPLLQAYGAIHPSCPPAFAYDCGLYDIVSEIISKLIVAIPFYHLYCKPDREAVQLSCRTIFGNENNFQ